MSDYLRKLDVAVAAMTAAGASFALSSTAIGGVSYRTYASIPETMADYFKLMLRYEDREFAVYLDQRYSYAQAYAEAAALATALIEDFGVAPGDRVAILSRNNPQWMIAFIAALSIGAVAVPMNAWWTGDELDYGLRDCGATVVLADRQRIERLDGLIENLSLAVIALDDCADFSRSIHAYADVVGERAGVPMPEVSLAADDYASIMYTSGSTGHPKGALSSHRGILSALFSWALLGSASKQLEESSVRAPRPPVGLLAIPLFHCTASHTAFLLSLLTGRTLVIMHKWDAEEALRLIEEEQITWFTGVPTMSAELAVAAADSDRDLSSLAEIFGGGAARPPAQVEQLARTFATSSAGIGYGLTETNALGTVNSGKLYLARPGSAGMVVPAVTDIAIFDDRDRTLPALERGEICIRSPANVVGYWNKAEESAEAFRDGWFHTGDIGYLDEEGFLYVVDRMKEIIIRGGENISCIEVEAAVYQHPAVAEAAVFGVPDERLGEAVACAVVLKPGELLQAQALVEFLARHLAKFKLPLHVRFFDESLPRIASGKIFKRQLQSDLSAELKG